MKKSLLILSLICTACGSIRVQYDYDKNTDFSNYNTYNYYPDLQTGLSELDTKRLLRILDSVLQTKGIRYVEEADFLINIESREFRYPSGNTVGVGVGGGGRNVGGSVSIGLPIGSAKREREIVFDFVDSQRDALFWQALSESSFRENASPSTKEKVLQQIVAKVLSRYPPKTKK